MPSSTARAERQAPLEGKARAVDKGAFLAAVVEVAGVDQDDVVETVAFPVVEHLRIAVQRHHGVVFLRIAVPDQHRQKVGDVRVGGVKVHHGIQDVGFTHAAVADGHREQLVAVQVSAGHGKVLSLAQRACGRQQAGDGAGEMAEQTVLFAKTLHHVLHTADAHFFQRRIEEHRGVETGCMVTDFGDDIGVAEHHQRRVRLGAGGETARVAGTLGGGHLQGQVAQCVGAEQRLVDSLVVATVGDGLLTGGDHRLVGVAGEFRPGFAEILDAFAEGGSGSKFFSRVRSHGAVLVVR